MSTPFEMRGPDGVREFVTDFLRAVLPSHLQACREAWGLSESALPEPVSNPRDRRKDAYFPLEPPAIDRWPMLAVTSGRYTQGGTIDYSIDGDPVFKGTYPIRVYSWVRAGGHLACQRMRDNFGTALRICFMAHTNLADPSGQFTVIPRSTVLDFSDITEVKGERFVGGSYVGFDLQVLETLTDRLALPGEQPRDTVSGVTAIAHPVPAASAALPPHPALQ